MHREIAAVGIGPGLVLSPQTIEGGPQTVTTISITNEEVTFATVDELGTERTWTVPPGTTVGFPRRPDGVTYDWRLSNQLPTVLDLAYGDLLPSQVQGTTEPQRVVAIQRMKPKGRIPKVLPPEGYPVNGLVGGEVSLMTVQLQHELGLPNAVRRYTVFASFPLAFPRPAGTHRYERPPKHYQAFKYRTDPVAYRHRDTGALFRFQAHPSGRGPWPKSIPVYDPGLPERDRPYHTRPPRLPDHLLEEA